VWLSIIGIRFGVLISLYFPRPSYPILASPHPNKKLSLVIANEKKAPASIVNTGLP